MKHHQDLRRKRRKWEQRRNLWGSLIKYYINYAHEWSWMMEVMLHSDDDDGGDAAPDDDE